MFKYMKDEEWDILIPVILILIICIFALNHYAEENAVEKTSPDVGVMLSDREFGIAPYIMGCDWTDEKDGHREKVPYDVSSKYLMEVEIGEPVNAKVVTDNEPFTSIRIKVFPEECRNDYSKGILISESREFICSPGCTYAIEVEFGKNKRMYAFKCV